VVLAVLGIAALVSAPDGAGNLKDFNGPLHYCGMSFSIDLAAGEKVQVKDPGLDFIVEYIVSDRGGFAIYEGNAPQGHGQGVAVNVGLEKPVKRAALDEFGTSYLIETGMEFPAYAHAWGQAFDGTANDLKLLKRLDFRSAAARGCATSTYQMN
jgi:hypothetical protein